MNQITKPISYRIVDSPIGPLTLVASPDALVGLYMNVHKHGPTNVADWQLNASHSVLKDTANQLTEFFEGRRELFDLPLRAQGTEFQRRCWEELAKIPFGETWSYGQMAKRVGNPDASRAVGAANGKNPISIVVPCHRVTGASGKLVGFGGGLPRKSALLSFERAVKFGESAADFWMENELSA